LSAEEKLTAGEADGREGDGGRGEAGVGRRRCWGGSHGQGSHDSVTGDEGVVGGATGGGE
jgi:hypothetical protein